MKLLNNSIIYEFVLNHHMYKEISTISLKAYSGFVRTISLLEKERLLLRIEYNIEWSNEVGYVYEKAFATKESIQEYLKTIDNPISNAASANLRAAHLSLLADLIAGKIAYLAGFSCNCTLDELKSNYNYILAHKE